MIVWLLALRAAHFSFEDNNKKKEYKKNTLLNIIALLLGAPAPLSSQWFLSVLLSIIVFSKYSGVIILHVVYMLLAVDHVGLGCSRSSSSSSSKRRGTISSPCLQSPATTSTSKQNQGWRWRMKIQMLSVWQHPTAQERIWWISSPESNDTNHKNHNQESQCTVTQLQQHL